MLADAPRVPLPSGIVLVGTPEEIIVRTLARPWLADARAPDETERRMMLSGPLAVMLERYDEPQLRALIATHGARTHARDRRLFADLGGDPSPIEGLPRALDERGLHQRVHQHMLARSRADDVAAIAIVTATSPLHVGHGLQLLLDERMRFEADLGRG